MKRAAVSCLAILFACSHAPAATFNVTKTADTADGACTAGDCSLREAIIAANANPADVDNINIPPGTYTLTRSGANENASQTGDLDILGPVNLVGAGAATTIVQAGTTNTNGIDKVLSINPNFNSAFATSISGLTIRFGRNPSSYAGDGFGGGLDWEASGTGTLNITNCTISDNSTTDGDGGGLTATNSPGGANGRLTISNTVFSNNTASRAVTGNSALGGAIFLGTTTPMELTNCTFTGNRASNTNSQGGAIFIFGPAPAGAAPYGIHGCTFASNQTANDGGGIYSTVPLLINQACVFSGNASGRNGGAVWLNHSGGTSTITGSTFTTNTAASAGGAIRLDSAATSVLNVTFCRIVGNTAPSGGAVSRSAGTFMAENNWWGSNSSPAGVVGGTADFDPWLQLNISASLGSVLRGGNATLTATLTKNSNGAVPGGGTVPNGIPVSFAGVLGTVSPSSLSTASGTATSTYTAGNNCGSGSGSATVDSQTASVPITVASPPITATLSGGGSICAGDSSAVTVTVTGGIAPYSVTLTNGGGTRSGPNPLVFNVSPATATTYAFLSGSDAGGCSLTGSGSVTVTVVTPPTTATTGPDQTICIGSPTAALGGNPPSTGTGLWSVVSGATGTFSPSAAAPDAVFTPASSSSVFTLRWTISNAPCPPSTKDVTITVRGYATADFNKDCRVDLSDYKVFAACATGPRVPYQPAGLPAGCTLSPDGGGHIAADFDQDGDVDQADYGSFQRCYSGGNPPADPNCAG